MNECINECIYVSTCRWYRDPNLPISRTDITRFPHAVLEVKLSLPEGQTSPEWVTDLTESGFLTEVCHSLMASVVESDYKDMAPTHGMLLISRYISRDYSCKYMP